MQKSLEHKTKKQHNPNVLQRRAMRHESLNNNIRSSEEGCQDEAFWQADRRNTKTDSARRDRV